MTAEKSEYDAFAPAFARSRTGLSWPEVDELLDAVPVSGDGPIRILDAGCGSGRLYPILAARFGNRLEYRGFDLSAVLVGLAKKSHPDGNFRVGDLRNPESYLPPSGGFRTVFAIASFHHLLRREERSGAFACVFGALAPGGVFAMTNWNLLSESNMSKYGKYRNPSGNFEIPFSGNVRTYAAFDPETIASEAERAGFVRASVRATERNVVCAFSKPG